MEEWERERIFRKKDGVRVKIFCQLTYQGYVLHHWVWGIEARERDSVCWAQKPTEVTPTKERACACVHTHTRLIYFYRLTPALLFFIASLHRFLTSALTHSTSQRSSQTLYFTNFLFHIHMLHTLSCTILGGMWNVLAFVCNRTTLLTVIGVFSTRMCLPLFVALWAVVGKEWLGDRWGERSFTGSLPAGTVEHSRAKWLEVPLRASSSTSCHLRFHTLSLGTASPPSPRENCLSKQ